MMKRYYRMKRMFTGLKGDLFYDIFIAHNEVNNVRTRRKAI